MKKGGKIIAPFFILIMLISPILLLPNHVHSVPVIASENEGVTTVQWDFSDISDYNANNVSLVPDTARLSLYSSEWRQATSSDFNNGTTQYVDISSTGELKLNITDRIQILENGNFTAPDDNGEWDSIPGNMIVDGWASTYLGDFGLSGDNSQRRVPDGGLGDNGYCWRNFVCEWDPSEGYNATVWLNQTFSMPSIPLSVNVSAFHRFDNSSISVSPGSLSKMIVTRISDNQSYILYDSGFVNESYADYKPLWWNDASIFTEPGLYNLTLLTYTNTSGNIATSSFPPVGIYNYWDTASLTYNAYRQSGTYISEVFDAGSYAIWKSIAWNETLSPDTSIEVYVRTGNSTVPTDSIWSDWTSPLTDSNSSLIDRPWGRYIQYRVEMATNSTNSTPVLSNITVLYDKYCLRGFVETGDFTPSDLIRWGQLTYTEELSGQAITYQFSTDSGTTWKSRPLDGDLSNVSIQSGSIRFRAVLITSDAVKTPAVHLLQFSYISLNPSVLLQPLWNRTGASPGQAVRLTVHFNNTEDSLSSGAWINVYLDARLEYVANNSYTADGFQYYIQDDDPNIRKFYFSGIAAISQNSFWIDARLKSGLLDGDLLQSTITLDYEDPLDNRVESVLKTANIRVNGPKIEMSLRQVNDAADVGDTVTYILHVNNTGKGTAEHVWINATLDERLRGGNITWDLLSVQGNSSNALEFNATLGDNVAQGTTIPMSLTASYSDSSGHVMQAYSNSVTVSAKLKSQITLAMVSQYTQVNSSELQVITVHFNNTGYGSADSVRFNFTVPEEWEFISTSEEGIQYSGMYVWELENIGPGTHSFTITLKALKLSEDNVKGSFVIYMAVTDPIMGQMPQTASVPVQFSIIRIYTIWEQIYWPWSGFAMAAIISAVIFGLWYCFKPVPPSIDDAFVIYRDGRLISHRQSVTGEKSGLDGDLVGAMLNAVQDFISDSLSNDKSDKVKKLEFGERELFLERGSCINLVVIYSGSMNRKLEAQVRELVEKIEIEHDFLQAWDGRMTQLSDVNPLLDNLIKSWQSAKST